MTLAMRVRGGFSLFIAAAFAIGGTVMCAKYNVVDRNGDLVRIGIGLAGLLLWLLGGLAEAAKTGPKGRGKNASLIQAEAEHPLAYFKSPRAWGMIFVLAAGAHGVISILERAPAVQAQQPPVRVARVARARPPVTFPPLQLQGLAVNGAKSSALINGEVLYLGDGIGNVRLVAVEPEQVEVELGGQTNVLHLRH